MCCNYYFVAGRFFFINYTSLTIQLLYLFIFSLLFFYLLFYIINKINRYNFFLIKAFTFVVLLWLLKETINAFVLMTNSIQFGEIFTITLSNFFEINKYFLLIIENFSPYIFSFFMLIFFYNKKKEVIKFITITGFILFTFSTYEFLNKYNDTLDIKKNYSLLKSNNNKKVLWIIFDEFDNNFAFNKSILNNFENFKDNSVYAPMAYSPGSGTTVTMPSTLMNTRPFGFGKNGQVYDVLDEDNKLIPFIFENTIFNEINKRKLNYEIFSSVLRYCSILNIKNNCTENWQQWHRGIFFQYSIVNKIITFYYLTKSNFTNLNYNFDQIINTKLINKIKKSESIDGYNNFDYTDFEKSLKNNTNFIFMHLYMPHMPAKYSMKKFNLPISKNTHLDRYYLNLKMSDEILKKILKIIDINHNKDQDLLLVFSSDHWYRKGRDKVPYPTLFISKILGDNNNQIINQKINLIFIYDLILDHFDGKISSNKDISEFFEKKPFYNTFNNK